MNFHFRKQCISGPRCFLLVGGSYPKSPGTSFHSELIEYLRAQQKSGNKLILWTCLAGEALEKAASWCREHQLEFDAINDNLPEIVEMYGNNSRKITCDYYIDDKAVLPAMVNG